MNDLQTLRTALSEDDPSEEVKDRSRERLRQKLDGAQVTRRPRRRWLVVAPGITAAAAAAAVAVAVAPGVDEPDPSANSPAASQPVTGRQVLLAAASSAEHASQDSGAYWHVRVTSDRGGGYERWITPDGRAWFRGEKSGGKVTEEVKTSSNPFGLVGVPLTLDELNDLPTDPEKLESWIAKAIANSDSRTSAGEFTKADRDRATLLSLISLVSTQPAPPAVRAAAFRAIADYPGVTSLGKVPGGQAVRLPEGNRLVVDPKTGRVNRTSTHVAMDGTKVTTSKPETVKITTGWTDDLPD